MKNSTSVIGTVLEVFVAVLILTFVATGGFSSETYEVKNPTVVWSTAVAFNSRGIEVREQCVVTSGKIVVYPRMVSVFKPTWEGKKIAPETEDGIRGCQPDEKLEWTADMRGRFPTGKGE